MLYGVYTQFLFVCGLHTIHLVCGLHTIHLVCGLHTIHLVCGLHTFLGIGKYSYGGSPLWFIVFAFFSSDLGECRSGESVLNPDSENQRLLLALSISMTFPFLWFPPYHTTIPPQDYHTVKGTLLHFKIPHWQVFFTYQKKNIFPTCSTVIRLLLQCLRVRIANLQTLWALDHLLWVGWTHSPYPLPQITSQTPATQGPSESSLESRLALHTHVPRVSRDRVWRAWHTIIIIGNHCDIPDSERASDVK